MQFPRFVVAGLLNTGATYVLYLGLLLVLPYAWAYTATYVAGIALGYVLNTRWVFRRRATLRTGLAYPLTYVVNYALSIGLLWLLVEKAGMPKQVAPLLVVAITTPVMFVLNRFVFVQEGKRNGQAQHQ